MSWFKPQYIKRFSEVEYKEYKEGFNALLRGKIMVLKRTKSRAATHLESIRFPGGSATQTFEYECDDCG